MNPIFKKLNYKDQKVIHVFSPPPPFLHHMEEMRHSVEFRSALFPDESAVFILAFVTKQSEIDEMAPAFAAALVGDGVLWFAYPKGTSKNYKCDFNRDTGWDLLGQLGFESVRMVSIDEDWSALRFRRTEFIKTMKREEKRAMSAEGKKKIGSEK
jgi:hypothetical protein